ncbi:hypothetical protein ACWDRX_35710, partial [Streptomyces nigra]
VVTATARRGPGRLLLAVGRVRRGVRRQRLTATAYPADIPQLDAYAAVTTVLGGPDAPPAGERAAERVAVRDTSDADAATGRATLLTLLGSALVLAVLWAAFTLPRARARGWRPARAGDGATTKD